ncbi:CHAT domain-containing protein [Kamptonema formosum]|uniref:CHAT domain-containing protein n=1 Tax=Kamptonema formosum TaxID=331992 RepID=UPI00037601B2|nr:CHAT domain-containing protein [Kamptonema formosum]
MARKKTLFSRSVQSLLNHLFLGAFIAFICVLIGQFNNVGLSPVSASNVSEQLRSKAQNLIVTGHEQLALGKAELALQIWEQATEAYTQLGDKEGIAGSQINQSIALQALGQYRRACHILLTAVKLDYQDNLACKQPNETDIKSQQQREFLQQALGKLDTSKVVTIGLQNLGDVLRIIGNIDNSEEVLKKSLEMARTLNLFPEVSVGLLSYGNTKRGFYNRMRNSYERTELSSDRIDAIEKAEQSLRLYQEASDGATANQLQSKLNRLSLLIEIADWLEAELKSRDIPEIKRKLAQFQSQIQPQVNEIFNSSTLFSNLPPIQSIYAKLNLAISLGKLNLKPNEQLVVAIQYAKDALQQAKDLKNQRAEAYAYGVLGKLYKDEQINQLSLAESSTEKAVYLSQSIQANDIAYKWQYQLGNIYEKTGRMPDAIAAYNIAVNTLEPVRQDLLSINPDVQFSFRENVKPVYDDLIRLLLQSELNQDRLKRVTEVIGQLQFAELQNFLQCSSLGLISLSKVNTLPDAVFYIIALEDQKKVEVIVSLGQPNNLPQYHYYSVDWQEFQSTVKTLRSTLQNKNFIPNNNASTDILSSSQKLYQLLIAPAKSYLPKTGTLVFVLDSELQSIPMALLQDEDNQYLVEKYSITVSLGARSLEPKFLPWQQSRVLIAGVSKGPSFKQEEPYFEELINIKPELDEIRKNTVKSEILYNEDFTKARFQNKVTTSTFPVLHIATHGIFSSNPEQTVILAHDTRINIRQLDRLLRGRTESSRDIIELLVLSACQTATGDKRAGLGIAGVAVQAGARSTLASLWNVSDKSTSLLMGEFYRGLKAGLTKAEALRKAQISFLKNPENKEGYKKYAHPYYWAPFILVGSWL